MPVWHEGTAKWVKEGKLVLLGVTQEQHADRCRLLAQWKGFGWPILHDPINVLEATGVPILVAVDEHGIVRSTRAALATFQAEFLDKTFADDAKDERGERITPALKPGASRPDWDLLQRRARQEANPAAWRALGDALALWGGDGRLEEALDAYGRAAKLDPKDGPALFRLGVCYRRRYETTLRRPGDFQAAIDTWGRALDLDPNQYIWRRRIQQYGPRLDKPYAFYDWIEAAEKDLHARGQKARGTGRTAGRRGNRPAAQGAPGAAGGGPRPRPGRESPPRPGPADSGRSDRSARAGPPRPGRARPGRPPPRPKEAGPLEQRGRAAAALGRSAGRLADLRAASPSPRGPGSREWGRQGAGLRDPGA